MITLYHNESCSKSNRVYKLLESNKQPFTVVNYLVTPPTASELADILKHLNITAFDLVRKGEPVYKSMFEGKTLNEQEWIEAMVQFPILIERPIVVTDKGAVIGRPPEKVAEVLG